MRYRHHWSNTSSFLISCRPSLCSIDRRWQSMKTRESKLCRKSDWGIPNVACDPEKPYLNAFFWCHAHWTPRLGDMWRTRRFQHCLQPPAQWCPGWRNHRWSNTQQKFEEVPIAGEITCFGTGLHVHVRVVKATFWICYTCRGESDVILFHIYASWFLPPSCR